MAVDLAPLFAPRQVAVLGASRSPEKLGHRLLQNLLGMGFDGEVLPVNPSGDTILGLPSVVGVAGLPTDLDLALVSLPAAAVLPADPTLGTRR
jgi:acetyltransferase